MPKKKPLDTKGHYRILKVDPEVGPDEIRLATAMAKQNATGPYLRKIEEAYETLSDPAKRAEYDVSGVEAPKPLRSPVTLAACLLVLAAVLLWLYVPAAAFRRKSFSDGQSLVYAHTQTQFGTVVRFDSSHLFPQGIRSAAYLIRMAGGGERWFPADDLKASCEAQ